MARTTLRAMENISLVIGVNQLGITVCSLVLGAVAEPTIAHLLEPALHALSVPESFVHPIAFAIGLTIVVYLHVVMGEMIPKNIALAGPERAALVLGPAGVGHRHRAAPRHRRDQRDRQAGPAAVRRRAARRGELDVHPRGGRGAGRGVARRRPAREGRVRPAGRRARLHREDRRVGADAARHAVHRAPWLDRRPTSRRCARPPASAGSRSSPTTASCSATSTSRTCWRPTRPAGTGSSTTSGSVRSRRCSSPTRSTTRSRPCSAGAPTWRGSSDADGQVLGLATLEDVIEELVGEIRDAAHQDEPA